MLQSLATVSPAALVVIELIGLLFAGVGILIGVIRSNRKNRETTQATIAESFDKVDRRFQQQELTLSGIEITVSPYAQQISQLTSQQNRNTTQLAEMKATAKGQDQRIDVLTREMEALRNR